MKQSIDWWFGLSLDRENQSDFWKKERQHLLTQPAETSVGIPNIFVKEPLVNSRRKWICSLYLGLFEVMGFLSNKPLNHHFGALFALVPILFTANRNCRCEKDILHNLLCMKIPKIRWKKPTHLCKLHKTKPLGLVIPNGGVRISSSPKNAIN